MSDKKKITILYMITIFLIILIGFTILSAILNEKRENNYKENFSQTTRRTVKTNEKGESTNTTSTTNSTTSVTISTNEKTTSTITTSSKKTSSTTTTKKVKTTTKTIKKTTTIVPVIPERDMTTESTKYPNAQDSIEWEIVELINNERIKNGLKPLGVSPFLRNLAEEAADYWNEYSDQEIKEYLYGYSNYRKKSNNLTFDNASKILYNDTKNNTNVTTSKYLRYLGVGVIYRDKGMSGIPTYYYVIIYE